MGVSFTSGFTSAWVNGNSPEFYWNLSLFPLARESQRLKESRFDTKIKQHGYCFFFMELLMNT